MATSTIFTDITLSKKSAEIIAKTMENPTMREIPNVGDEYDRGKLLLNQLLSRSEK